MSPFVARPYISACLVALWLLLTGFSAGNLVLGIIIAGIAVMAMRPLELPRSNVRLWPLFRLFGIHLRARERTSDDPVFYKASAIHDVYIFICGYILTF